VPKSGQPWDPRFAEKSPLFAPFSGLTAAFAAHAEWPTPADFTSLVEAERVRRASTLSPLEFVVSAPRPRRQKRVSVSIDGLYDGSIARRRQVPCVKDSYHDLWNAIAFAAFPRSKRALHARQYRALERWATEGAARLPSRRTREQDALTVFDEGGSVLVADAAFFARWREASDWTPLSESGDCHVVLFGHALMELLGYGRPGIRSCALFLDRDETFAHTALVEWIDVRVAARIEDELRFASPGADGVVRIDECGRPWVAPPGAA
jgi:hypothetical protein